MRTAKIRRTGNSNAVTLSPDLELLGYVPGAEVVIDVLPSGALQLTLAETVREGIRAAERAATEKDAAALERLKEYARSRIKPAR